MRLVFLLLAIIGYLIPNALTLLEMVENHNILLWSRPDETLTAAFANRISAIFTIDLLLTVPAFFIWSYMEGKKLRMKNVWIYWVLTLLFGLAGSFPLFLWARQKYLITTKS